MSLVLLSLKSAVAVAAGMVTWKSVASRLASRFRLMPFDEPDPVPVPVPVPVSI